MFNFYEIEGIILVIILKSNALKTNKKLGT